MRANMVALVLLLCVVVWLALHADLVAWTPLKLAGAALAGVSIVLLAVARIQLGASFTVKAKARRLVTTGLYAKIRNPIYLFGALTLAGMAIVLGNWVLLAMISVLVVVQRMRARREEEVLRAAFGEKYDRYKAQTWF